MSYNVPGQDSGFVRTDPPSTPCTGDFIDKISCREHGFFFWLGAFCVLIVVLGLCSCFVVSPLYRWMRERRRNKKERSTSCDGFNQTSSSAGRRARTTTRHGEDAGAKSNNRHSAELWPTRSGLHRKFHHWYLNGALKITPEDELELGPPTMYVTTDSTGDPSNTERNTRHNSRQNTDGRAPPSGSHVIVVEVVGDPGVGAEATARGGGWMGAANGRL